MKTNSIIKDMVSNTISFITLLIILAFTLIYQVSEPLTSVWGVRVLIWAHLENFGRLLIIELKDVVNHCRLHYTATVYKE